MECRECKYATEHNGAFFCMAQKNMPYVTGDGVCERWKPTYITNYDRIISKSPEELAEFLIQDGDCPPERMYPDSCPNCDRVTLKVCYDCWLDWLRQEVQDGT